MEQQERFGASTAEEDRYRLLVNAITDYAIYMLDPTGIVTSWNTGAHQLKGYTADEILGQHFSRFYTGEEQRAGVPAHGLETAAREGRFEREGWRIRKDGSRFWANVVIEAIRSTSGELIGFAKITRDLTDRRQAEEALRKSEEQFRVLVQSVTDYAIYMLDPDGRIASWNAGAQRIKGYLATEIIGEHFSRFYTEEERQAGLPAEGLDTARRTGRWEREGLRVRKDGSTFWAHVVIDAIRDARTGKSSASPRSRATSPSESSLRPRSIRPGKPCSIRRSWRRSASSPAAVAHDFNNLLMAALGSLELIRKRLPDDLRLRRIVDVVMQALQRGSALTERMLLFARRQEMMLDSIHVPTLLHGMQDFLQQSIGPTVRIDNQMPSPLPLALTASNQLETALLNLVLNARDAISGMGVVTISGRVATAGEGPSTLRPGDYVVVSVADTGEGMDAETLARATDPFFTTKGVGKGTGLGLSMVHGLAVQSGGTLVIESRKGEGTTVEIWLPVSEQVGVRSASTGRCPEAVSGPPLRVMLVDDDDLVLASTVTLLEDLGHHVISASSPSDALEAIKLHPDVDVVITDYAMPQMNGVELAMQIRRERPNVPIILATGYVDVTSREDCNLLHLKKPFTQELMQNALMLVVGFRSGKCPEIKLAGC